MYTHNKTHLIDGLHKAKLLLAVEPLICNKRVSTRFQEYLNILTDLLRVGKSVFSSGVSLGTSTTSREGPMNSTS